MLLHAAFLDTQVDYRAEMVLATGARCLVTLPPRTSAPERWAVLEGLACDRVAVSDSDAGLSASLRAGLSALPDNVSGTMVLLADMPEITSDDLCRVEGEFDGRRRKRVLVKIIGD